MGEFGFSYVGAAYLLLLFIPNLIWAKRQPPGYQEASRGEPRFLTAMERVGQVCVTCCAVCFSNFNPKGVEPWILWLGASFLLMLAYEGCWVRYFRTGCTWEGFYGRLGPVPVPLATLPVAAFLLLGVYGRVVWMILAALLLGIGHIGIHVGHARARGLL